jgi:hypothetical protein
MKFDLNNRFELIKKSSHSIDYKIEVSKEGKCIYERSHYPKMSFEEINGSFFIIGWIEPKEIEFLMNYIHQFGKYLINIHPNSVKQNFVVHLEAVMNKINLTE